jgi:dihydrofolate reductase
MHISIIAAIGKNRVIGNKGILPWNLPADMRHFRLCTLGKPVVMGSKTFASIGHPLPKRENIILTRNKKFSTKGCRIMYTPEEIIEAYKKEDELMIIGGASVYKAFFPHADNLYLTNIEYAFEGDVFFPIYNKKEWVEVLREEHEADEENRYRYIFRTLKRNVV